MLLDKVRFILLENGQEKLQVVNKQLVTIPGTGDIIRDPVVSSEIFKVKYVEHSNVFGSPGDHTVTVYLENAT